jgi:hypothetical protein
MQVNETHARTSKKDFILSRPNLSAKEIVAAAAEQGIDTTTAYVYVTRSEATKQAREPACVKPPAITTRGPAKRQELESVFVELVLDVGLARADALLGQLRLLGREIISGA